LTFLVKKYFKNHTRTRLILIIKQDINPIIFDTQISMAS